MYLSQLHLASLLPRPFLLLSGTGAVYAVACQGYCNSVIAPRVFFNDSITQDLNNTMSCLYVVVLVTVKCTKVVLNTHCETDSSHNWNSSLLCTYSLYAQTIALCC